MYNIDFKVKYKDIEEELILKLKQKTQDEYKENPDEEFEYSNEDILDICDKLYRDELLSVFGAETIMDNKIDICMEYVKTILFQNNEIKNFITELMNSFLKQQNENYDEDLENKQNYIETSIFISLFSQPIFYITHQCISQQIQTGIIENDLLVKLKCFLKYDS